MTDFHPVYFRAVTAGVDPSSGSSVRLSRAGCPGQGVPGWPGPPPFPSAAPQPKFCPVCADSAPACGNGLSPHLPLLSPARLVLLSPAVRRGCVTPCPPVPLRQWGCRSSCCCCCPRSCPPGAAVSAAPAPKPARDPSARGLALSLGGPRGAGLGVLSSISRPSDGDSWQPSVTNSPGLSFPQPLQPLPLSGASPCPPPPWVPGDRGVTPAPCQPLGFSVLPLHVSSLCFFLSLVVGNPAVMGFGGAGRVWGAWRGWVLGVPPAAPHSFGGAVEPQGRAWGGSRPSGAP